MGQVDNEKNIEKLYAVRGLHYVDGDGALPYALLDNLHPDEKVLLEKLISEGVTVLVRPEGKGNEVASITFIRPPLLTLYVNPHKGLVPGTLTHEATHLDQYLRGENMQVARFKTCMAYFRHPHEQEAYRNEYTWLYKVGKSRLRPGIRMWFARMEFFLIDVRVMLKKGISRSK